MSLSVILHIVSFVIFMSITVYLYRMNLNKKALEIYYFLLSTLCFSIFHMTFAIAILFYLDDTVTYGLLYAINHLFVFLALAFLAGFASSLVIPNKTKYIFGFVLSVAIIGAIIFILNAPTEIREIEGANYMPALTPLAKLSLQIFGPSIGVYGLIMFMIAFFRASTKQIRLKAFVFALGFLIIQVAGPMHNVVPTATLLYIADAMILVGNALILIGIFIPKMMTNHDEVDLVEQQAD